MGPCRARGQRPFPGVLIFRYTKASMPAKVCPRCGAQYPNLKSTTCPECFAVLVTVDDATAEELSAARAEVERSPEFQQVKAADDERFKEQSFGACLSVLALTVLTLTVGIVLLVSAGHKRPPAPTTVDGGGVRVGGEKGAINRAPTVPVPIPPPSTVVGAGGSSLPTLPVAAAKIDDVLPPGIGPYRRQSRDAGTTLTGTLTPLFHAVYAAPGGPLLDVYALPAGRPTAEQNEFRLGLALASQVGRRPLLLFPTEYWQFAVLAPPAEAASLRDALLAHFRG